MKMHIFANLSRALEWAEKNLDGKCSVLIYNRELDSLYAMELTKNPAPAYCGIGYSYAG